MHFHEATVNATKNRLVVCMLTSSLFSSEHIPFSFHSRYSIPAITPSTDAQVFTLSIFTKDAFKRKRTDTHTYTNTGKGVYSFEKKKRRFVKGKTKIFMLTLENEDDVVYFHRIWTTASRWIGFVFLSAICVLVTRKSMQRTDEAPRNINLNTTAAFDDKSR